jgi:RNA polymerase sigma-70 factor (TIGR02943 family)
MEQILSDVQKVERFRAWVREYSDMLYSHSILRGFDRDEAKDLVQDTFYSAWKNMDGFKEKASAKNWLFVILKNKITDHYRKVSGQIKVQILDYDVQFDSTGHWAKSFYPKQLTVDPSDLSDRNDLQRILESCSGKLNTVQKAVFFMKYLEDLDGDAICVHLSITANNYWTILHRAKVQLRACLEKNWFLIKNI